MFDCPCGKRLVPILRTILSVLYKFVEIDFAPAIKEKLQKISAATVDQMLKKEKKKLRLKGRNYAKVGSLLKHQIPIRTFDVWEEDKPGYV